MTAQWLRLRCTQRLSSNGTYINLSNGARLGVREYSQFGSKWEVWSKLGAATAETLADGYATEAEALSALDALMSEFADVVQLQLPASETADDEEVTTDDGDLLFGDDVIDESKNAEVK